MPPSLDLEVFVRSRSGRGLTDASSASSDRHREKEKLHAQPVTPWDKYDYASLRNKLNRKTSLRLQIWISKEYGVQVIKAYHERWSSGVKYNI